VGRALSACFVEGCIVNQSHSSDRTTDSSACPFGFREFGGLREFAKSTCCGHRASGDPKLPDIDNARGKVGRFAIHARIAYPVNWKALHRPNAQTPDVVAVRVVRLRPFP